MFPFLWPDMALALGAPDSFRAASTQSLGRGVVYPPEVRLWQNKGPSAGPGPQACYRLGHLQLLGLTLFY